MYGKQQFDVAEKMFRHLENLQITILGEKHTHTPTTKYWIASCLYKKRQFDNAGKMFRDVENMRKEVLGEKHADAQSKILSCKKISYKRDQKSFRKKFDERYFRSRKYDSFKRIQ